MLKPGGVLRLALPDLDKGDRGLPRQRPRLLPGLRRGREHIGGKFITQMLWYGYSRTLFTHEFVEELLLKAGFSERRALRVPADREPVPEIVELDNREQREPVRRGGQVSRPVLFYRDFKRFTGGDLKVWDYFNHVRSSPRHARLRSLQPRARCGTRRIRGRGHASSASCERTSRSTSTSCSCRGSTGAADRPRTSARSTAGRHQPDPARAARRARAIRWAATRSCATRRSGSASAREVERGDRGDRARARPGVHDPGRDRRGRGRAARRRTRARPRRARRRRTSSPSWARPSRGGWRRPGGPCELVDTAHPARGAAWG